MVETFINAVKDDKENEYIIIITGDHTTPTQVGDHTYEPVPIMFTLLSNYHDQNSNDLNRLKDGISSFNELEFQKDEQLALGRFPSKYVLQTAFKMKEKVEKIIN